MERMMKNGVMRLPPGFRFHPTDEELVVQYLKRKVFSYPLPSTVISEFEVCREDPWDFPGNWEHERYFFTTREVKYSKGNRSNRSTASGYWKATGLDKQVVSTRSNHVVGMKKTLVFYRGKPRKGCKTDWIMHEYRLQNPQSSAKVNWVLCRVFLKKKGSRNGNDERFPTQTPAAESPVFYDFMAKDVNVRPANSSSGSSDVTAISPRNEAVDHGDDSSSCCNSFIACAGSNQRPSCN